MPLGLASMFWPSSKLSWEMKQELRKRQGAVWGLLFDFALPTGTLHYSLGAVGVPGVGNYEARIKDVSSLTRSISDRSGRMQDVEVEVVIDDTSLDFATAVTGPQGHKVRGSTFTQTLFSPNVPRAQWFTALSGVIHGHELLSEREWKLSLRPNDQPLKKSVPKPVILQGDWPNADPAVYAQYGPLLYGTHDSSLTTKTGAVPLIYVDKTAGAYRYLVCWGRALAVDAVYSDGVKQTTGWTASYREVGGRTCTVVTFTADQVDKAITADVRGYATNGDGTGVLIDTPTDVIRHFITNWIFNDYKTGAWFSESTAPIDSASFAVASAFFARSNAKAARRIFGAQRLGLDIVDEWAQSWEARLFWTNAGKIGCRVEDYEFLALYRDEIAGWIRLDGKPHTPNYAPDWEGLIDRVNVEYHYQEAAGKYLFSVEVRDPTLTVEAGDPLQQPWSSASF